MLVQRNIFSQPTPWNAQNSALNHPSHSDDGKKIPTMKFLNQAQPGFNLKKESLKLLQQITENKALALPADIKDLAATLLEDLGKYQEAITLSEKAHLERVMEGLLLTKQEVHKKREYIICKDRASTDSDYANEFLRELIKTKRETIYQEFEKIKDKKTILVAVLKQLIETDFTKRLDRNQKNRIKDLLLLLMNAQELKVNRIKLAKAFVSIDCIQEAFKIIKVKLNLNNEIAKLKVIEVLDCIAQKWSILNITQQERVLKILEEMIKDQSQRVKVNAIGVLANLPDQQATELLDKEIGNEKSSSIRLCYASAFKKKYQLQKTLEILSSLDLNEKDLDPNEKDLNKHSSLVILEELIKDSSSKNLNHKIKQVLESLIKDSDLQIRIRAIRIFGILGHIEEAFRLLKEIIEKNVSTSQAIAPQSQALTEDLASEAIQTLQAWSPKWSLAF